MQTRGNDGWSVELVVGVVALVVAIAALAVALTREPGTSTRSAAVASTTTQPLSTSSSVATTTTLTATPTTAPPVAVGPTIPKTTPTTKRSNYCDITAAWYPRDSHGFATVQLRVTSDEPRGAIGWEVRETKSTSLTSIRSGAGFTDANGFYAVDASGLSGDVMIYVRIGSPQFAQCSLASHVP